MTPPDLDATVAELLPCSDEATCAYPERAYHWCRACSSRPAVRARLVKTWNEAVNEERLNVVAAIALEIQRVGKPELHAVVVAALGREPALRIPEET